MTDWRHRPDWLAARAIYVDENSTLDERLIAAFQMKVIEEQAEQSLATTTTDRRGGKA